MRSGLTLAFLAAAVGVAVAFVIAAVNRRPTRVYQVPSRLPPELVEQILRRKGPYEHRA